MGNTVEVLINLRGDWADKLRGLTQAFSGAGKDIDAAMKDAASGIAGFEQSVDRSVTGVSGAFGEVATDAGTMAGDVGLRMDDAALALSGLVADASTTADDTGLAFGEISTDAGAMRDDVSTRMTEAGDAMAGLVSDASTTATDTGAHLVEIGTDAAAMRDDLALRMGEAGDAIGGLSTDAGASATNTATAFDTIALDSGELRDGMVLTMGAAGDAVEGLPTDAGTAGKDLGLAFDGMITDAGDLGTDLGLKMGAAGDEIGGLATDAGAAATDTGLAFDGMVADAGGFGTELGTQMDAAGDQVAGLSEDAATTATDTGTAFDSVVTDAGEMGTELGVKIGEAGDAVAGLATDASDTEVNANAAFDALATDASTLATDLDTAATDAGTSITGIGTTATGMGEVVGTAAAVVLTKFTSIKDTMSAGFDALTGDYSKIPELLGMIPGPVGNVASAVGGALADIMQDTVDTAEHFRKLQEKTGATVEFLSGFTEVADDYRIDAGTVGSALEIMSKKLGGIADMSDGFNPKVTGVEETLNKLGISARDANGDLRPMEELIPELADAFASMGDGPGKTAIAVELFGRRGTELIPVLNNGSKAMFENMAMAKAMGLVYTQDVVNSVDKVMDAQDNFNDMLEGTKRTVGAELAPELARYMGILTDYTKRQGESNNIVEKALLPFRAWIQALTGGVSETEQASDAEREHQRAVQEAALAREESTERELAASRAREETGARLILTTRDTVAAYQEYDEAAVRVAEAEWKVEQASKAHEEETKRLAAEQRALHDSMLQVIGAVTNQAEAMDAAERVQTVLKVATGEMSITELENKQAVEATMKALKDKDITEQDAIVTIKGLADGTLTAEQAFSRAGNAGNELKKETDGLKDSALRAQGPIKDVGTALDNIKPKDVTLTVKGKKDATFVNTDKDYKGVNDDTATKTVKGHNTPAFIDTEGRYHGISPDNATKTVYGVRTQSFEDTYHPYISLTDAAALKTIFGRSDGSFNAASDAYRSVQNGSATATIHVSTDVNVNWTGPYGNGFAAGGSPFPGGAPGNASGVTHIAPQFAINQPLTVIGRDTQTAALVSRQLRELARTQALRAAMGAL